MKPRGFTIVEIVITLTIMGILMVLAVVNLTGTQANGRDAKRKSDIETIAINLENYYNSGSGEYPPITLIDSMSEYLPNLDKNSIMAPGIIDPNSTFKVATNSIQTTAGVLPSPTIDDYIYQPITNSGALCINSTLECRKFNLFYRLEIAVISPDCPDPGNICKLTSKHQ